MEPGNNQQPIPPIPQPAVPPAPGPQPAPSPQPAKTFTSSQNPAPETGSNKFVVWLLVGLVLIILMVGGVYLYLSRQQAAPAAVPTPTPVVQENLEDELNAINIASPDADFTSVDQDIEQL
ncbi:LPXTG cell wall anchor domain-containing protein [Patescibacteria group bacterium]|nr:LPXTG cell wall anchor domain-containing protein [Patescibacteria group bacterium]